MKRIAIIGPESTGKTDLAMALAKQYNGEFVPEFAREYLNKLSRPYIQDDLLQIAKGQIKSVQAVGGANFLFADTDLHVIKIWSEHKYKNCDPWIFEQLEKQTFDLYILTYYDTPYEQDPLRENPNERAYFFEIYKKHLEDSRLPFFIVKRSREERLKMAMNKIDALL
jgi:NadR type nicotinamide-nucleotide adenylyltransferase